MTQCSYANEFDIETIMEEVYKIPAGGNESIFMHNAEDELVDKVKSYGYEPLSCNSTLISKRRYKRKVAKENAKRSKQRNR